MPEPTTDIITGYNPTDLIKMENNTRQIHDELFKPSDINMPNITIPSLPDFGEGMVDPNKNINIKDDPNYQLNDYKRLLANEYAKYPGNSKKTQDILLPQSQTDRYINEDYGFQIDRDNEDFYAHQQGAFKEIMKAIFVKLPTYTFTKLGTGLGYVAGLINPDNWGDNYIAKAGDNIIAKTFSDLENDLKNKYLTTFRYTADQNKGFFERAATDLSFWTEDLIDGAAFMASAFVPGMAISKLGLAAKIGEGLQLANAVEDGSKFMQGMAKGIVKYGDQALTTAVNTASESMFEAKGVRDKVYADLINSGKYTADEADKISGQKAKDSFLWNIGALTFSNAWETNLFFKGLRPTVNKAEVAAQHLAEDYATKAIGKFDKLKHVGKTILEGVGVEGFYEENIQLAIQRKNEGRNTYDGYFTVLNQMIGQTFDALAGKDKEAMENIGMGGLIGLFGGTGVSLLTKEYEKEKLQAERVVANLNNAKNNWLKSQNVFKVDENGELVEDKEKVAALLMTQLKIAGDVNQANVLNNKVLKNLVKKEAFASFVIGHLNQNTFDTLQAQLDKIPSYKPEELIKLGFDPEVPGDIIKQVQEYKELANKIKDVKDVADRMILGETDVDVARRNHLLEVGSRHAALEQEANKIGVDINTIRVKIGYESISDSLVDTLNNLKVKVQSQKEVLKNAKEEDNVEVEKKLVKYENEYEKFVNENKDEVDKLKKTKDGYFQYEDDRKNMHPLIGDFIKNQINKIQVDNAIADNLEEYNNTLKNKKEFAKKYDTQIEQVKEIIKEVKAKAKETKEKAKKAEKEGKSIETTEIKPDETVITPTEKQKVIPKEITEDIKKELRDLNYTDEEIKEMLPEQAFTIALKKQKKLQKEEFEANYRAILAKIPAGKNINVKLLNKISEEVNEAFNNGKISSEDIEKIYQILNIKNPVGTIKDTAEDFADEIERNNLKKDEEQPRDISENGFNPDTNKIEEEYWDEPLFSGLAYNSSNKNVTQEETYEVQPNGNIVYTGELDQDPYKNFAQGFNRYGILHPEIKDLYRLCVIKDRLDLPRDNNSAKIPEDQLGEVNIVTDKNGNILYFDKDYNPSYEKSDTHKELIYSFNKDAWKDEEEIRAWIGELRTGKAADHFIEMYQRQAEERALARELARRGIPVMSKIIGISAGAVRQGTKAIDSEIVLAGQPFTLHIPESAEKFDPEHPKANKYVFNMDGQTLLNGAIYLQTQRMANEPYVYTRIIPNRIGENPQLFKDLKELLLHKNYDENTAQIIKSYLNDILFLGFVNRPRIVSNINSTTGFYEIAIMQNNEIMPSDEAVQFISEQRMNINKKSINGTFEYYSISEKGKIKIENKQNYNQFVIQNSKTRSRSIETPQGKRIMAINSYMVFQFNDGVETMAAMLRGDENAHPTEIIVDEKIDNQNEINEIENKRKEELKQAEEAWRVNVDEKGFPKESLQVIEKKINDKYDKKLIDLTQTQTNSQNIRQIEGLSELISSANLVEKFSDIDKKRLTDNPLPFFEDLKNQAMGIHADGSVSSIGGQLETMDKNYGKEFMTSVLNLFGIKRDNSSLTETPITRRERHTSNLDEEIKKTKDNEDDINKGALKSEVNEEQNRRDFIESTEVANVINMFGGDVAVTINNIINSEASAIWTTAGITLFNNAKVGDAYHEAWHNFSQLYLTKIQKTALYNEVRKRGVDFKTRDGRNLNSKSATDLDIEEFVADDFRDYVLKDGKSILVNSPQRNTIFRKILDFIKKFFFDRVNIENLYNELRTGDLNKYTPSINNAFWGKLNSSLVNDLNQEIFDNRKTAYYRDVVSRMMGKIFLEKNTDVKDLRNSPELLIAVYDNIYNKIADRIDELLDERDNGGVFNEELYNDLYKLTDNNNWNKFVKYHIKSNKLEVSANFDVATAINDIARNEENLGNDEFIIDENKEENEEESVIENPDLNDDDQEDSANMDGSKTIFDNGGNEVMHSNMATIETKSLVKMLAKAEYKDGKFIPMLDSNGFEKLCDFSHVWNNLAIILADTSKYTDMYKILQDPINQRRVPEIAELLKNLPNGENISSKQDLDRVIAFCRDFNKAYVPIYSGHMTEDGTFFFREETKRNSRTIENEWTSNFLSISSDNDLYKNGYILMDDDGRNYINPDNILNFDTTKEEDRNTFSELLGFKFSPETLQYTNFRIGYPNLLSILQNNINERFANGQKITNPVYDLKQDLKNAKGEIIVKGYGGRINAFIGFEAKFSSINPSMSYQTPEGNLIYGLMLNNFLTRNAQIINNSKTLGELISKPEAQHLNKLNNPYVTNSLFLNTIFNEDGTRNRFGKDNTPIKIIVGNYSGFKISTKKGDKAYSTTNLNTRDKIIMDMNALLVDGASEIMRTESSKTAYFIKLNNYRGESYLPIPISDFYTSFRSPKFMEYMIGALTDELTRMKTANDVEVFKNSEKLLIQAKQFNLFRDILKVFKEGEDSEKLKKNIYEDIKTLSVKEVLDKHNDDIETAIIDFFNGEQKRFVELLNEEGITREDHISKSLRQDNKNEPYKWGQLIRTFIANNFILNIEYTKLFDGDTVYQAHYKDYHKRSKGAISTGNSPITDDFFARYMQQTQQSTIAGFMGVAAQNDYKTTKSLVVTDDVRDSAYLTHGIIESNLRKTNPLISEEKIQQILSKYKGMTIGDGQGHITLDFYRQFLMSISNWSDEQEIGYQKELSLFRLNNSTLGEYSTEQKAKDKAFLKKYENVITYFPPIKMQYNGPIQTTGTYAQVMDKFSVAPLIPSVIQGTNLEKQNLEMIKKGIGYSKYESGTKKYKAETYTSYGATGHQMDLKDYNAPVHYLEYLKEQINTSPKVKKESIFGSQIRKLILANVFSNGTSNEININRRNGYIKLIQNIRDIEKEKLFNELGLKDINGKTEIDDLQRFVMNIQKQADLRELNDNVKDYIQYDKDTKSIKYPLEASLNKKAIQGMLMGIIDRRIRKQNINGDMLIQVSTSGFEGIGFNYSNPTLEDTNKWGTNGTRFYDVATDENGKHITKAMGVKVALIGGFEKLLNKTHPDGKMISTIERLNELLKDEKWMNKNREHVTMVGYRIPTQGINSIEFMEVAEFLPTIAGNIIIPPAEIVAKSGSDFDIDKMSIFRPSFDKYGNLISDSSIKDLERLLEASQNKTKIDSLKNKFRVKGDLTALSDVLQLEDDAELDPETIAIKKEISKIRNSQKELFSNKIIKLYTEILSDPDMYEQLITPNDTNLIKPISKEVALSIGKVTKRDFDDKGNKKPYSGTQIYRYKNNLRKFESLLSAKSFLAIGAVNNSFMVLLQQADIAMNTDYNYRQAFVNTKRKTPLLLLSPSERQSIMTSDGRIGISSKFNVHGELKQEYVSQFMNGTVDAASDDFLGYININRENIGVLMLLMDQGVPFSRALWFINQPVMLRYYSDLKGTSLYKSELQGKILGNLLNENYFYETTNEAGVTFRRLDGKSFNDGINNLLAGSTLRQIEGKKVMKKNIPETFYFDENNLKKNIVHTSKVNEFLDDAKNKKYQAAVFAYFISLQEQTSLFRNFQSAFNMDTRKMQNQTEAYQQLYKTSLSKAAYEGNILKQGLFGKTDIEQLERNSVISPFIANKVIIYDMVRILMPYISTDMFSDMVAKFVATKFLNKTKMAKMIGILENDWLEYIIKSFSLVKGLSLATYSKQLLTGKNSLAKQLITLRNTDAYKPLLEKYQIFGKLRQSISSNPKINNQNIEVQKLFEDTVDDQNRYIVEFRQLLNFSDPNYTKDQQNIIKNFFHDLAILGFAQSGFNKGPISFQELIPYEEMADMFNNAMKRFKEEVQDVWQMKKFKVSYESDKVIEKPYQVILEGFINDFLQQFKANNPTLVSTKAKSIQSWRGKKYYLGYNRSVEINAHILSKAVKNQLDEMKRINFAMLNPEIDGLGNIILKSENINNINNGKQDMISLGENAPNGEISIYTMEGNQKSLIDITNIGQYRINQNDGMVYKLIKGKDGVLTEMKDSEGNLIGASDPENVAIGLGYKSFAEMSKDPNMLAFTAGFQVRNVYKVRPIIAKEKDVPIKPEVVAEEEGADEEHPLTELPEAYQVGKMIDINGNLYRIVDIKNTPENDEIATITLSSKSGLEFIVNLYDNGDIFQPPVSDEQYPGADKLLKNILPSQEKSVSSSMEVKDIKVIEQTPKQASEITFKEHSSTHYAARTKENASKDATLAIAEDFNSLGEKATKKLVLEQKKQYFAMPIDKWIVANQEVKNNVIFSIVKRLNDVNAKTLNIAGNGIYTLKGKYTQKEVDQYTYDILKAIINHPNLKNKIESVVTGGQTGFDEAGAKAAQRLGIPTIINAPKGWKFRDINGKDISNEKAFKARFDNIVLENKPEPIKQKKELFTTKKAKQQNSFRSIPLKFVSTIQSDKSTAVAMRNTPEGILINEEEMEKKFNTSAWTRSATQSDGSKSTPLAENEFRTFDEFFTFALLHESKHATMKRIAGETIGQYEDRINQAALKDLRTSYNIKQEHPSETIVDEVSPDINDVPWETDEETMRRGYNVVFSTMNTQEQLKAIQDKINGCLG